MGPDISGMPDPSSIGLTSSKPDISGMPDPTTIGLKNPMNFTGDETPEEAEMKANVGSGEVAATLGTGALAAIPSWADYVARSAVHGVGALIGNSFASVPQPGDTANSAAERRAQINAWLQKKHDEDKDAYDSIMDFWTYHPRTEQAQAVLAMPQQAAHAGLHAVLPDNAAQAVEEAGGGLLRAVPPFSPKAVASLPARVSAARAAAGAAEAAEAAKAAAPAAAAAAPSHAVTADQLRAGDNPIPPPNDTQPVHPSTERVQPADTAVPPAAPGAPPAPEAPAPKAPAPALESQRGSVRLFHPPAEDGPQYAATADKAAQDTRQQTLGELNRLGGGLMTHDRQGALTGDWSEAGNEHQTALLPDKAGQLMRDQIASEHRTLTNALQSQHEATGATAGNNIDRDTLEHGGGIVRDAVHAIEDHFTNAANGAYQTFRATMGDKPITAMPRVQAILNDTSHDVNPTSTSLRQAAQARLTQLWSVGDTRGDVRTAPGTVGAAERFHEFLNEAHHNDSASLIRKLKNATDMDVAEAAGGNAAATTARNLIKHREQLLEPDGVNELRRPKDRNKIDHDVAKPDILDHVTSQDSDHFQHFMNVLRSGAHLSPDVAEKSAAAIREIQGHMIASAGKAARGEGGQWNAKGFHTAMNRFSANMPAAFRDNPEVLKNLQTINRGGNILKMDRSYPGAVAQAAKAGLLPNLAAKGIKTLGTAGTLGGAAHGNVPMAAISHLGEKFLGGAAEKLLENRRLAAARASLIERPEPPLGAARGNKERGAVGDLNQYKQIGRETTHDDGVDRDHMYTTPGGGRFHVMETPGLGVTQGLDSLIPKSDRGQGWGTQMLKRAVDDAHARGQTWHSDMRVSEGQAGAYANLKRMGYDVKSRGYDKVQGELHAHGDHVFEIRPREAQSGMMPGALSRHQAGSVRIMNGRMMKRSFPGDKQRGSVPILNIGHNVGNVENALSKKSVATALAKVGAKVESHDVLNPDPRSPNLSERTSVVGLKHPLGEMQGIALARSLGQKAIAERTGPGEGYMHVPPEHAAAAKEGGWSDFNGDYFHHANGETEAARQTGFNPEALEAESKGRQTVTNPKANHYPGIYDDPKDIVSKVETAPESPNLKRLFGVTRKDLHDSAIARGDIEPKSRPVWEKERGKGSENTKDVMNEANAERLRNTISALKDHDEGAYHGMVGWYEMDPMYQSMKKILGNDKAAGAAYHNLNSLSAMASPVSAVDSEIRRGYAAAAMHAKGELGKFTKYGYGDPAEKRIAKNAPELAELGNVGHTYHGTAHAPMMERFGESGMEPNSAKANTYRRASDAPSRPGSDYQNTVMVGDSHFARASGFPDVRTAKNLHNNLTATEAKTFHPWYHENVAKPLGLPATSAQAVQWGAFSHETGVRTAIGAPKLEIWADRIVHAAKEAGIDPKVMWERMVNRLAYGK